MFKFNIKFWISFWNLNFYDASLFFEPRNIFGTVVCRIKIAYFDSLYVDLFNAPIARPIYGKLF